MLGRKIILMMKNNDVFKLCAHMNDYRWQIKLIYTPGYSVKREYHVDGTSAYFENHIVFILIEF